MENGIQSVQFVTDVTDITPPVCKICTNFEAGENEVRHQPFLKMPQPRVKERLAEFVASGGLVMAEGDEPKRMSMETFAHLVGWSRQTMYDWMDADPDWDAKVMNSITRVHGAKRVARVLRGVFVQASMGKSQQAELYLRQFWPEYKAPKEEKEHTFTGLADLYKQHAENERQHERERADVINVVDTPE